jgi:hypothetical protein
MKLLDNLFTQPDSKVIVETDHCKIESFKIADDLSTATITIHANSEYMFTARSGILTVNVGAGVIRTGSESFELNLFNKVALERNDRVTITNNQTIPLILNFVSAN